MELEGNATIKNSNATMSREDTTFRRVIIFIIFIFICISIESATLTKVNSENLPTSRVQLLT